MPRPKLHADPFGTASVLRRWERDHGDDPLATPFQSPAFHRLYERYASTTSALLLAGEASLPMTSRPLGFGLHARGLSPIGQYGGPVGGPLEARAALLAYAEQHVGFAEACLPPASPLRFREARRIYLGETSLLRRGPGGWTSFRSTKRRHRVAELGLSIEVFGPDEVPSDLYELHVAQHARWQTPPMPRGLHDGLTRLAGAATHVLYAPSGRALAYYLSFIHRDVCYSHRGVSSPEGREVDAHRVLHGAVLSALPASVTTYDLGASVGLRALKAFKLSIGAGDVPVVAYARPSPALRMRRALTSIARLVRG